jgi:predicted metalloprotease
LRGDFLSKKKNKINKNWFLIVIIAVIVIFVLMLSTQPVNVKTSNQEQNQQTQTTGISNAEDICKNNHECFLVSCKNTPNNVECVNATHEELYYKDCGDWKNILPAVQNFTKCSCVQGFCKTPS